MISSGYRSFARAFLATVLLSGCVPDDQTNIKPEHLTTANPVPVSRNGKVETFKANNDAHKVILAVFDTGVDYNHPRLRDHMHFTLNDKGVPTSAGLDFLALDEWASPRLIETSSYEFKFLSEKQKKKALDSYKTEEAYNDSVRREKMGKICATTELGKIDPRLNAYLQPYRAVGVENSETKHGTHVAGLMSYDNPAIGLIPYKVIPYHETEKDEADFARGKADRFVQNFEKALEHARAAKVKVVNLSLGGSFEKPTNSNDASYEGKLEKYNNYKRMLTVGLTGVIKKYSEILFVAAAGNDSGWSDNEARLQYPCGIEATNVLCVGALNKDGTLAKFTNLPLNKVDLVMASGVKLISTVPHDNCDYLRKMFNQILIEGTNDAGLCSYDLKKKEWAPDKKFAERYKPLIDTLYTTCSAETNMFESMSGTSMATPVVSRLAADVLLERPNFSPEEVIKELKQRSTVDKSRQFVAYVLKAKQPSWYKLFRTRQPGDVDFDQNFNDVTKTLLKDFNSVVFDQQRPSGGFEFMVGNLGNI